MINDSRFKNKKIAVVGAGIEGVTSKKWLEDHGAVVTVVDKKDGADYLKNLHSFDLIVRSPGVKLSTLKEALGTHTVEITSQTKLFFDLCPAKIIGVTGTKGKGTTSSLIYEMLKKEGKNAYLGGNIGKPPFEFLDALKKDDVVVLELSSFQLQDLHKSPHIGVVLMITSEHLDYHKDVYEYVDAKRNIIRFQGVDDFAVINKDYVASHESDVYTDAAVFQVSREREADRGAYVLNGSVWMRREAGTDAKKIIDIADIILPGAHNLENVCAAVTAATLTGVSKEAIVEVLKTFKGLEHRLEHVATVHGVKYFDDSFSTTPETAIAAIQAFKEPEILILGGSSKGSDFSELGDVIYKTNNIRAIIGIGVEWEKIKKEILKHNKPVLLLEGATSMEQIVLAASKVAQKGDVVLLTPACASFDMFENYKERGNQFKEAVHQLIQ